MDIRICTTTEELARYSTWVQTHPQGSLWQSLEWKQYQEALEREVRIYIVEAPHPALSPTFAEATAGRRGEREVVCPSPCPLPRGEGNILASALVVIDRTIGGCSTWDVTRGPLIGIRCPASAGTTAGGQVLGVSVADSLLQTIVQDAQQDRCFAIYLSPQVPLKVKSYHLKASHRHEQPTATRIIDLTKSEEEILAQMHPKGRYNIKVAQKNGVQVEQSDDVEAFYSLLQQTAGRDGFQVLPLRTYKAFLECLPGSFLLLAPPPPSPFVKGEGQGERVPIAGLIGVMWPNPPLPQPLSRCGRRGEAVTSGIYYYGASDYTHRALMAPYALQWEAMRLCKAKGCTTYDLLGIAPRILLSHGPSPCPLPRGEGECATPQNHPWAGISAFKEKFGGTVVTYPPEQQIVLRPLLWKILQWKRRIVG